MTVLTLAAALTALGAGVLGGVWMAFSTSVMPALARRPGAEAAATMQEINRTILNPRFLLVLAGTAITGLATAVLAALDGGWALVAGALLTVAGAHLITAVVHVPLNVALDAAPATAEAWERFAGRWARAHLVRTVITLTGAAVLVGSLAG